MELRVIKKPDLVVAMDIGSTYSGYAWQWRGNFEKDRSKIEFNTHLGKHGLCKTTTCILLNGDKEIDSFGHLAEKRYCNESDKANGADLLEKWYFFKNFKMVLYNEEKPDADVLYIDDRFGHLMLLVDVMSKFIFALRGHFLNMMEMKNQSVNPNTTLWVITVPAIWTDAARKFMSLAAEKSGIKRENLLIALEPEAAALHCFHLPSQQRLAMKNFGEKGDSFLSVDLGGGTTDVLALKVRDDGTLEEISMGSGGHVGGQNINDAFFHAITDAFKTSDWSKVAENCHAVELLEMETDFESKKVELGYDNQRDELISLNMPDMFETLLNKKEIQLKNTKDVGHRFHIVKKKFLFNSEFIRETLFNETVKLILKFLEEILSRKQLQEVKHVVLVGGFSESPIVVNKVQEFINNKFTGKEVVVPTSPFTSVLSGAVLYGHDPLIFNSRISRATYGIKTNSHFNPDVHKEEKKWTHKETGKDWCNDIFSIHVRKDSSVKLGEKQPSRNYYPIYKDQQSISFPIIMSTADCLSEPAYTTDAHCKQIGEIKVAMPDTTGGTSRTAIVTMIYGGTELDVVAKNESSGEEYKATLRFDVL